MWLLIRSNAPDVKSRISIPWKTGVPPVSKVRSGEMPDFRQRAQREIEVFHPLEDWRPACRQSFGQAYKSP